MVSEDAEKNQITVGNAIDLGAPQKYGGKRIAADQTLIAPHGNKAALFVSCSIREPIQVLAPFAASVDERAGKYVVVFHRDW